MKRRFLQIALVSTTVLSLAVFAEGCGLQGEGQRCSTLNNSDDCDTGLECVSKNTLNTNSDICCPINGGKSSEAACIPGALTGNSTASSSSSSSASSSSSTSSSSSSSGTTTGAGDSGGGGGAGGAM